MAIYAHLINVSSPPFSISSPLAGPQSYPKLCSKSTTHQPYFYKTFTSNPFTMLDRLEALITIDWAAVFCFFAYITSSAALPIASRLLLKDLHFPFPAALAAVHAVAISMCLVFWTLLSIFKPRIIRLCRLLPLSVMHTLVSLSHMHNLYHNSLLHYQLARFVPVLALSWTRPSESSARDLWASAVRTRRGQVMSGIFLFVACALILLHPPASPMFFVAAVAVPLFDLTGHPQQLRSKTRATDLQLQLFTRSLSAAFLCVLAPDLDTKHNSRLLQLMFSMITELDRPASFFLYSSALLAFFTFVSVRVAHAKLEPYVFRTASVLAAVPPLVVHFVMEHGPVEVERTIDQNTMPVVSAVVWRFVDATLIFVLLATVHHITVSTMPGYDRDITGRIDDEEAGDNNVGGDDDVDDNDENNSHTFGGDDGTRLILVGSRDGNGSGDNVESDGDENSPSPTTENISERECVASPLQVATTTVPSTLGTNLQDHTVNCCTIQVSPSHSQSQ